MKPDLLSTGVVGHPVCGFPL